MIAIYWTCWWSTQVAAFHVQPRLYFLVTNGDDNSSCGWYTVHLDDQRNLLLSMYNQDCISWWSIKIVAYHRQRRMRSLVSNEGWSLTCTINTVHLDVRRKQQLPMRDECVSLDDQSRLQLTTVNQSCVLADQQKLRFSTNNEGDVPWWSTKITALHWNQTV